MHHTQAKEENASARKQGSQKKRTIKSTKGGTAVATGQGQSDFRAERRHKEDVIREKGHGGLSMFVILEEFGG